MDTYSAGLLSGNASWEVDQWHDYLREELERAHDFYEQQYDSLREEVDESNKSIRKLVESIKDDANDIEYMLCD